MDDLPDRQTPGPRRRVLGNRRLLLACAAGGFVAAAAAAVWWRRSAARRAAAEAMAVTPPAGDRAAVPAANPVAAGSEPAAVEAPRHQPYDQKRSVGPFRATSPSGPRRAGGAGRRPETAPRPRKRLPAVAVLLLVGVLIGGGAALLATAGAAARGQPTEVTQEDAARPPATLPPASDPVPRPGLEPLPAGSGRGPRPATPETAEAPDDSEGLWERLFG